MSADPLSPIDGIHHVTAVTADAQANVDFYVGVLGLALVKRSIVQGASSRPPAYHLFYGDQAGRPGSLITFFAYPGLVRGRAGAGMVGRVVWRLGDRDAVDFWAARLGVAVISADADAVVFADPDGLEQELRVITELTDPPLCAEHPEIPSSAALRGIHAVRAGVEDPAAEADVLTSVLGFSPAIAVGPAGRFRSQQARGPERGGFYLQTPVPDASPRRGAGTVHHVAWTVEDHAFDRWVLRLREAGVEIADLADRYYFRSVYFRLPGGVLFELATRGPGFGVDEPLEQLGSQLSLPPEYAERRAEIEVVLPPLRVP